MENASKALLMAGGILIAIIIIGLLLLMVNQIGSYQKSQDSNKKDSQLAEFNLDFERYTDDKGIKGTDIISLINKVIDYNKKARTGGVANSVDYNIKMSIEISGLTNGPKSFIRKYPVAEQGVQSLFSSDSLVINETNQNKSFKEMISSYSEFENTYTLSVMNSLASNYNEIKNKMEELNIRVGTSKYNELIEEFTGRNISNPPNLQQISQYKQYSEFKSATFKTNTDKETVYENGQIKELYFKFIK